MTDIELAEPVVAAAPSSVVEPRPAIRPAPESLYRLVWRWHFYAGMFSAPFLLVIAITGGLYVFKDELEPMIYRQMLVVEPKAQKKSFVELMESAKKVFNDGHLEGFLTKADPTRTTAVVFHGHNDLHQIVYVNPYTAEVTGQITEGQNIFEIILKFHRNLFIGTTGRIITELATCWGIVLLATGVYLWWPRGQKTVWGVFLPRLNTAPYIVFRDLHAVPAVYLSLFLFLVMFTGLFFSSVWGKGYVSIGKATGSFTLEMFRHPNVTPKSPDQKHISPDEAYAKASPYLTGKNLLFRLPDDSKPPEPGHANSYGFIERDPNRIWELKAVVLDPYTGELIKEHHFSGLGTMMKVRNFAIAIHMGTIFGMPTKILAFAVTLVLTLLCFTGVYMWWLRRPKGRIGVPLGRLHLRIGWPVFAATSIAALIMPVFGISLLLVAGGEWLTRRWFG